MKGFISGIKRMEIHDGDGIRTTVFFKGCPLKCIWCHNPESISFERQTAFFENKCVHCNMCGGLHNESQADICPSGAIAVYGKEYEVETLSEEIMQDQPYFLSSGGGITLSGGECLYQPGFAAELAKTLSEKGISVYVDTCGYVKRETLEKIIPYTDKFLYDIKAFDSDIHKICTGKDNGIILDNLAYLCKQGCRVEIRYPLVKGFNDNQCLKTAEFLKQLNFEEKIKVLQYHRFASSRYSALGMQNTLPDTETTVEDVENAVEIFKSFALNAVNGITES